MQVTIRCPDIAVQLPLTDGQISFNIPYEEWMTVGEFRQFVLNTLILVMPDPRLYMSATVDDVDIIGANLDDTLKDSFRQLRTGMIINFNILPSAYHRLQLAQQTWSMI
jgi:hypothetical protein